MSGKMKTLLSAGKRPTPVKYVNFPQRGGYMRDGRGYKSENERKDPDGQTF